MDAPPPRYPSLAQIFLGLFIVGQLIFMPASNLIGLVLWDRPQLAAENEALRVAADVTGRWGQMTGQVQNWRLFAPNVPTQAIFLAVELRWTEAPRVLRLPSFFEPDDPHYYFHAPGSADRLFHYESRLGWALVAWDPESVVQRPDEWREYIADDVRRQWPALRAYLRWRLDQFRRDHPERPPPDEAVLLVRIYPTPPPGQAGVASDPVEMPLARWRPCEDCPAGSLPVEPYDHAGQRFTRLTEKPQ